MLQIITDSYKSIDVLGKDDSEIVVTEGNYISFVTETGEEKTGRVVKFSGKGEKTTLTISPKDSQCHEIWSVVSIVDGSLKLVK